MSDEARVEGGYEIGRDESGLTAREREVLAALRAGTRQAQIARDTGLTRARISLIVKQLRSKGFDV